MPKKIKKLRIAVVGCGRISERHFDAIRSNSNHLILVAICDVKKDIVSQLTHKFNVNGYTSFQEMISTEKLDIIAICTPSGLHPEQTILAANHGIHVISEKPIATSWVEGKRMVRVCKEAGVKLFVVKQNRNNATLKLLRRAIVDKRFGKIYMVNINVFWTRPQEYYDSAEWRGTWRLDGGAFMNQASHYVDLIDWLMGPVDSIHAMTATQARNIEVEDTGVINIRWKSGALGSMNVTMLTYPKNYEGSITIIGEKGTVRIGGVAVNKIQNWDFEDKMKYDLEASEASYETSSVYGFGHKTYYEDVINSFLNNTEPMTDGHEGLKSLEILTSIYLSAKDGKIISLPLR